MKQLDLFGGDAGEVKINIPKKQVFSDYDSFIAKFDADAPKTTDDCYTPQPVYDAVLNWLKGQVDIEGRSIVRPFYPGGDYKNEEYPENCVVVDNPPFSILAEIVTFYIARKIDFFLFAPGLTLFSSYSSSLCTAIVANAQITYHNGAVVPTGFLSSLFPGVAIMVSTTLHDAVEESQLLPDAPPKLRKYEYPNNVVSSALLNKAVGGGDFIVLKSECEHVRALDAQRAYKKSIFGNGYLLSTNAAKAYVEAVAKAVAKAKATDVWELSPRELKIIEKLDAESCKNDNCT